MKSYIFFFSILLLIQCSSLQSGFVVDENIELVAPVELEFTSQAPSVDSFYWTVNGQEIARSSTAHYTFKESGKYRVRLAVSKGNKTSVSSRDILIKAPQKCRVIMETSMGDMVFELHEETPDHLNNFIKLVKDGYYNGLSFHRVMSGFMIQAGDNKTREGEYKRGIYPEIPKEINTDLLHYRGVLAVRKSYARAIFESVYLRY
mgnify:CR=1 FL=1